MKKIQYFTYSKLNTLKTKKCNVNNVKVFTASYLLKMQYEWLCNWFSSQLVLKVHFTLHQQTPTNGNRHICQVLSDQCVTLSVSVGIGRCLSSPTEYVESAFVRSWNY